MTHPLAHVRTRAREERKRFGGRSNDLLPRLRTWLLDQYQIELVPVDKKGFLQGSRGEIVPAEGCLYYDRQLDQQPQELLEVVAHEYGHIVLHHCRFAAAANDLIRGSVFLDNGAPALSRYSPKSREEAEASAFAAEFICPAVELLGRWRLDKAISPATLAAEYHATASLIRLQLAEGLYEYLAGDQGAGPEQQEQPCTSEQEEAAKACGFPALVDAGPGTGKTKTLVRRVAFLVRERHVDPEKILLLTFSNEAATEMRERILKSLGEEVASRILVSTFHGFGVMLLDALGHHVGLDVDFSVLDDTSQEELISELLGKVDCEALIDIKNPDRIAAEVTQQINYLKDRLIGPGELRTEISAWKPHTNEHDAYLRSHALLRLFEEYERTKKKIQKVDFPDLIQIPHQLLALKDELRQKIRSEFPWVLVDEYQDVSRATSLFLQQICGMDNPPWVVGDARQAIYRFRGAEPENVRRFDRDFQDARTFQLSDNYRSAPEIISVVNRLGALLDNPNRRGPVPERWRAGAQIVPLGSAPVRLAAANSDIAERQGVVQAVRSWLSDGAAPEQIAVIARRNVDVRNIAIALKKQGIRAVTSGLLTAEGAGGDLSAVLTAVDHQQAVTRLVYALRRRQVPPDILNNVNRQVLAVDFDTEAPGTWTGPQVIQDIAADSWRLLGELRQLVHSGDGWAVLCDFLFFLTDYVRDLLEHEGDAESAVQLEEVLSALSLAASYRFSHPHVQPRWSRLGLAERLRKVVTQAAPGLVPPRSQTGAVRVMTCHASKGLEFPCVAVAGQSLADIPPMKPCLPPALRPNPNEDKLQAESLLFVGVSRAKRSAVISYAISASGRPRSKPRRFPDLLIKLRDSGAIPVEEWTVPVTEDENIQVGRVWGGERPLDTSLYSLSSNTCRVKTYLEEELGARFNGRLRPLYPEFIQRVRRMLSRVIELSLKMGHKVSEPQADQITEEEWPVERHKDHPHISLYRPRAIRWTRALAQVFDPLLFKGTTVCAEPFEWEDARGARRTVKLQLIGHFLDANGDRVAIGLQIRASDDGKGHVKWSDMKDYHRLPFVFLHERHGDVRPLVFFGEEGQLRAFRWHRNKPEDAIRDQGAEARHTFEELSSGVFDCTINDWICDRCPCRTICPGWIGAIPDLSNTDK